MSNINDFIGGYPPNIAMIKDPSMFFKGGSFYKTSVFDAEKEDGSYLKLTSVSSLSYYNSSDVLQWTITATNILGATATGFTPFVYLDGANDKIYVDATDNTNHRLGVITISTGAYSNPGTSTTSGCVSDLSVSNGVSGFCSSSKNGNVITSAIVGRSFDIPKRYTVDVTTGAFDSGTNISNIEHIPTSLNAVDPDKSFYSLKLYGLLGQRKISECLIPQLSEGLDGEISFMGESVYLSSSLSYDVNIKSVMINKYSFKDALQKIASNFISKNISIVVE